MKKTERRKCFSLTIGEPLIQENTLKDTKTITETDKCKRFSKLTHTET